jgi:hypothetical protein
MSDREIIIPEAMSALAQRAGYAPALRVGANAVLLAVQKIKRVGGYARQHSKAKTQAYL